MMSAETFLDVGLTRIETLWEKHRQLIERWAVGDLASSLVPRAGVERGDGGLYEAADNDPQFAVPRGPWGRGYYLLYVYVDSGRHGDFAKLYADDGDGFREERSFGLRLHPSRPVFRIVRFDGRVRALRFDPVEQHINFQIRRFRFHRVPAAFARRRMIRRLMLRHPEMIGRSTREVVLFVRALARARGAAFEQILYALYGETFLSGCPRGDYPSWQRQVEAPMEADVERNASAILGQLRVRPRISVLMATSDPEVPGLEESIDSVLAQTYPEWELCIADDASKGPLVRALLERFAREDDRIKLRLRAAEGRVCRASNDALSLATGEFVALLGQGDVLPKNALLHVARAVDAQPGANLLYGDEDKLDASGERVDPHFKPRWNPELLLAHNYIGHLAVARTERVRALGGFRPGFEGSHDYDLLLRLTEGIGASSIVHVPHVLYHWRHLSSASAATASAEAGKAAVGDAIARRGESARVDHAPGVPNAYRVRWALPAAPPLVSLLVPTRDGVEVLSTCVDSVLARTSYPRFELLVVDNGSVTREALAYLATIALDPRVRVLRYDAPFNFSAINNFAVQAANGELVGLVNNDVEVIEPDWLSEMVSHAVRPEIGCVGAKLLYPDGTVQHGGVITGIGGVAGHAHRRVPSNHPGYFGRLLLAHSMTAVTAACLLVRKGVYEHVGGLDERLAVAFNDVDFCLRVREAGYRNIFTPHAVLYHHESATRGHDATPEKAARYQAEFALMKSRWGRTLGEDPAYNPNLSRDHEDFSIGLHAA